MTEQLKAEAYVREQRPALMELTFGCEIWPTQHREDMFTTSLWNVVAVDDRSLILRPKGKNIDEDMQTVDIKYCKIIGHPINLHDWLGVLDFDNDGIGMDGKLLFVDAKIQSNNLIKFNKTVKFNLTTGQPATQADYRSFCDIIGL